jgi:hypothetical protein
MKGQQRLGAVESSNVTRLVYTWNQHSSERVQVKPDNVRRLIGELQVGMELDRVDSGGLQAVAATDPARSRRADTRLLSPMPRAPMTGRRDPEHSPSNHRRFPGLYDAPGSYVAPAAAERRPAPSCNIVNIEMLWMRNSPMLGDCVYNPSRRTRVLI